MRTFCGVYVSNMRTDEDWEIGPLGGWEIWEIKMMGLTDSPYNACQDVTWAKKIALGNWRVTSNLFKWDRVVVKFMESEVYDYKRSWLYKERKDGMISAEPLNDVDDGRPIVPTEKILWEALWRWGST